MSEDKIQEILANHLMDKGHRMVVPNTESIHYEADLVSVTKSGYSNEYEIKCSRNDYNAELRAFNEDGSYRRTKAMKHRIQRGIFNEKENFENNTDQSPSKFWLVTPYELVDRGEIPEYWGLYWIFEDGEQAKKVKNAKAIHLEKVNAETLLDLSRYICSRYWRDY